MAGGWALLIMPRLQSVALGQEKWGQKSSGRKNFLQNRFTRRRVDFYAACVFIWNSQSISQSVWVRLQNINLGLTIFSFPMIDLLLVFSFPSHPIILLAPRCYIHLKWGYFQTWDMLMQKVHSCEHLIVTHPCIIKVFCWFCPKSVGDLSALEMSLGLRFAVEMVWEKERSPLIKDGSGIKSLLPIACLVTFRLAPGSAVPHVL